ncbi:hypothetical protein Cs7R123_65570 [Catellatospora sp. TT07R-123]|uniref:hypothetical protein n=1 Tax=Catellatospora sp. TT07R-123 TaxID=2733863 RepID=UPI001B2F6884|nr:hypothetical protein [Catellatospora sp. TT07R-123]GHJ49215.1 hypothetical protein Cs7R123_65570 [Catellatospora sp. TT07R-123]
MSIRRITALPALLAGLLVAALPGVAQAAVSLADGAVVAASAPETYLYTTGNYYWSVAAVQPAVPGGTDLTLNDGTGAILATSIMPGSRTDFTAVNSNSGFRPLGRYQAVATGTGSYWVQQRSGAAIVNLPPITHSGSTGPSDPDLAFATLVDHDIVSIADIWLTSGQQFWAATSGAGSHVFLLSSTAGVPGTYVRNRTAAASSQTIEYVDGCTRYTATATGWHALVVIGDRAPVTHVPTQGVAYALKRVDPATPNSCPVRNFPDPTP